MHVEKAPTPSCVGAGADAAGNRRIEIWFVPERAAEPK